MKISAIKVKLTENDIKTIIDEYLHREKLKIEKVEINDFITIYGEYKNKFNVRFKIEIGIGKVYNNELNFKIFKIKLGKLPVPVSVANSVIKYYINKLREIGISVTKNYITLNLDLLMKFVPYTYLKLKNLILEDGAVELEAEDVIISQNKEEKKVEFVKEERLNVNDGYTDFRNNVVNKIPKKYDLLVQYVMLIPDLISLLCRLVKDKRVNIKMKILISATITYLASPIDILPDIIPIIGKIDDISVAFFVLDKIVKEIPPNIIKDNWEGKEDIILKIREGAKYICEIIGTNNVSKIFVFIRKMVKNSKKINN